MLSLSAKNLGFIFDSTLSFSKQISSLSSACHYHIHDLRRIRHTLDSTTATTIATALVHSRLDYCNSLYRGLLITQIKRLQHIQNELACAVTRTPKHFHISPVLKSLHWLKVEQRIQYKIITHNLLHITEPKYLHKLINIKPPSRTRSSDHLSFPSTSFHQAQVCRSIIPQLLSPLMELSTNKSKIHHSTTFTSSTPSHCCRALFFVISFFRALIPTSSLFPTLHNFPLSHLSLLLSRPASFNQYSSRINANKHPTIHYHLRVLVSRGLYKALLYCTYFTLLVNKYFT